MDSLEYIDNFYQGHRLPEETALFEKRMSEDSGFTEQVAFFLSARQAAKEESADESRNRFREVYLKSKHTPQAKPIRKLWYYTAAAAVVATIVFGIFRFNNTASPQQLATRYMVDSLQNLGVKMSGEADQMQIALDNYNQKKYAEALKGFESILSSRPADFPAGIDAGLAALQLEQYDKAVHYFSLWQSDTRFSNPALFYHALTLMKRNKTGDQEAAKKMLQQVVDENLDGEHIAREWLR